MINFKLINVNWEIINELLVILEFQRTIYLSQQI